MLVAILELELECLHARFWALLPRTILLDVCAFLQQLRIFGRFCLSIPFSLSHTHTHCLSSSFASLATHSTISLCSRTKAYIMFNGMKKESAMHLVSHKCIFVRRCRFSHFRIFVTNLEKCMHELLQPNWFECICKPKPNANRNEFTQRLLLSRFERKKYILSAKKIAHSIAAVIAELFNCNAINTDQTERRIFTEKYLFNAIASQMESSRAIATVRVPLWRRINRKISKNTILSHTKCKYQKDS